MSRWLPITIWFVALSAGADGTANKLARAGIEEFRAAYQTWDAARFAAAAEMFRQATTNNAANVTNFYWLGAAQFHRMLTLQLSPAGATNKTATDAAQRAALDALTSALKLDDHHAESHALLGTIYGMEIGGSLLRGLRFGPRVAKHRQKAMEFGATNPRVQYLLGVCQFHTAKRDAAWREALATLLTADKLFEAEARTSPTPLAPRWGHDSCLTFIGRSYEKLGQLDRAGEFYRKALAMHPAHHAAKDGLREL